MLNLIVTISPLISKKELYNAVEQCKSCKINIIRFNAAKITCKESEEIFYYNINYVRNHIKNCKILIDFPYPREKSRINILEPQNILRDEEYFITNRNQNKKFQNVIKIDSIADEIKKDNILYYGDGEGGFVVIDKKNNGLLVRSLCNFTIYNTKTISNSNKLSDDTCKNIMERICEVIRPNEIALSFVEEIEDLYFPLKLKEKYNFNIVSKIESSKGIINLEKIIKFSDKIMIARGDLGLYTDIKNMFKNQEKIFLKAKDLNKPIYVATDILESLNRRFFPSRADIIDISIIISQKPEAIILNYSILYNNKLDDAANIINQLSSNNTQLMISTK